MDWHIDYVDAEDKPIVDIINELVLLLQYRHADSRAREDSIRILKDHQVEVSG